ncbi:hypothetical protein H696_04772 [Fonticula alba]|uniref:Uncharacterized protein n=1 Tax=Fonticula alba TaxID=691883 RepID=A0A058Z3L5_FONAL|nr:hypothetical protein H696_04772 [Fonticula alba]KCV68478.1 hypothetical protein H696_04772 [Fonticula alba]|eukprot:XP_009496910.1 hypothetical protein H696_04772 [Fonticula alba]
MTPVLGIGAVWPHCAGPPAGWRSLGPTAAPPVPACLTETALKALWTDLAGAPQAVSPAGRCPALPTAPATRLLASRHHLFGYSTREGGDLFAIDALPASAASQQGPIRAAMAAPAAPAVPVSSAEARASRLKALLAPSRPPADVDDLKPDGIWPGGRLGLSRPTAPGVFLAGISADCVPGSPQSLLSVWSDGRLDVHVYSTDGFFWSRLACINLFTCPILSEADVSASVTRGRGMALAPRSRGGFTIVRAVALADFHRMQGRAGLVSGVSVLFLATTCPGPAACRESAASAEDKLGCCAGHLRLFLARINVSARTRVQPPTTDGHPGMSIVLSDSAALVCPIVQLGGKFLPSADLGLFGEGVFLTDRPAAADPNAGPSTLSGLWLSRYPEQLLRPASRAPLPQRDPPCAAASPCRHPRGAALWSSAEHLPCGCPLADLAVHPATRELFLLATCGHLFGVAMAPASASVEEAAGQAVSRSTSTGMPPSILLRPLTQLCLPKGHAEPPLRSGGPDRLLFDRAAALLLRPHPPDRPSVLCFSLPSGVLLSRAPLSGDGHQVTHLLGHFHGHPKHHPLFRPVVLSLPGPGTTVSSLPELRFLQAGPIPPGPDLRRVSASLSGQAAATPDIFPGGPIQNDQIALNQARPMTPPLHHVAAFFELLWQLLDDGPVAVGKPDLLRSFLRQLELLCLHSQSPALIVHVLEALRRSAASLPGPFLRDMQRVVDRCVSPPVEAPGSGDALSPALTPLSARVQGNVQRLRGLSFESWHGQPHSQTCVKLQPAAEPLPGRTSFNLESGWLWKRYPGEMVLAYLARMAELSTAARRSVDRSTSFPVFPALVDAHPSGAFPRFGYLHQDSGRSGTRSPGVASPISPLKTTVGSSPAGVTLEAPVSAFPPLLSTNAWQRLTISQRVLALACEACRVADSEAAAAAGGQPPARPLLLQLTYTLTHAGILLDFALSCGTLDGPATHAAKAAISGGARAARPQPSGTLAGGRAFDVSESLRPWGATLEQVASYLASVMSCPALSLSLSRALPPAGAPPFTDCDTSLAELLSLAAHPSQAVCFLALHAHWDSAVSGLSTLRLASASSSPAPLSSPFTLTGSRMAEASLSRGSTAAAHASDPLLRQFTRNQSIAEQSLHSDSSFDSPCYIQTYFFVAQLLSRRLAGRPTMTEALHTGDGLLPVLRQLLTLVPAGLRPVDYVSLLQIFLPDARDIEQLLDRAAINATEVRSLVAVATRMTTLSAAPPAAPRPAAAALDQWEALFAPLLGAMAQSLGHC